MNRRKEQRTILLRDFEPGNLSLGGYSFCTRSTWSWHWPLRANPSWYPTCMHGEKVWGCHVCFCPAGFLSLLQFLWEIVHNGKKKRVRRQMVGHDSRPYQTSRRNKDSHPLLVQNSSTNRTACWFHSKWNKYTSVSVSPSIATNNKTRNHRSVEKLNSKFVYIYITETRVISNALVSKFTQGGSREDNASL